MCCSTVSAQESFQIHSKVGTFTYPLNESNKHKVSFIAAKSQTEPADLGVSVKWARTNMEAYSDSAVSALGEGWRMPTQEEWRELLKATLYKSYDSNSTYVAANNDYVFLEGVTDDDLYDARELTGANPYPRAVYDDRGFSSLNPTNISAEVDESGVTLKCDAQYVTALENVGFVVGNSADVKLEDAIASATFPVGDEYSTTFNNFEHLQLATDYFYRPFAIIGGRVVYGDVASFRTVDVADAQTTVNYHADTYGWGVEVAKDMSESGAVVPTKKAWEDFCGQHSHLFAGKSQYSYEQAERDTTYRVQLDFTEDDLATYKHASRMLTTKWARYIKDARFADDVKAASTNARIQHCSDFDLLLTESIPSSFYTYITTESIWIPASEWSSVDLQAGEIEEKTILSENGEEIQYIVVSPRSATSHPGIYFNLPEELMACQYRIEVVMAPSTEEGKVNRFNTYLRDSETNKFTTLRNPDPEATEYYDETVSLYNSNYFESSETEIKTIWISDVDFTTIQYGTSVQIKSNFKTTQKNSRSRYMSIIGLRFTPVVKTE